MSGQLNEILKDAMYNVCHVKVLYRLKEALEAFPPLLTTLYRASKDCLAVPLYMYINL